jgi:hypothetical protein
MTSPIAPTIAAAISSTPEPTPATDGWRLILPHGTGWRAAGDYAVRAACHNCAGSGVWSPCAACTFGELHPAESCVRDVPCRCRTPMRAVLPRPAALAEIAQLPTDYGIPAALLYDNTEGGDLVSAIAITTDLRRGLAAINASARDELGHSLARPGPDDVGWPNRLVATRITGLLLTIAATHVDRYAAGDDQHWVPWDAQPAPLSDPDAVAGTWAEVVSW